MATSGKVGAEKGYTGGDYGWLAIRAWLYEEWITLFEQIKSHPANKIGAFSILTGQRTNCIHWIGIYPLDKVIHSL